MLLAVASGALALGSRLDDARRARPAATEERVVEGTVAAVSRGSVGSASTVDLEDIAVAGGEAPPLRRLRVYADGADAEADGETLADTRPGARIRAALRLRPAGGPRNPGGRDVRRALERAGIGCVGRPLHPALQVQRADGSAGSGAALGPALEAARLDIARRLTAAGPGGALLAALAVGAPAGLPPGTRDAFARLGLAHLLAVSGLHVGLVAMLAFGVARAALARSARLAARGDVRPAALALAVVGAGLYALLAGWGVPVRRATVLAGALALAFVRSRPALRAEPLAAAALWVLVSAPEALFQPGAQLSFAASAALASAAERPAERRGGALEGVLRTTATAVAATAPLAAHHFGLTGRSGIWALATNLAAVPWTACALLPAALAAAVASALPWADPALRAAAWLAARTLDAVTWADAWLPAPAARAPLSPLGWAVVATAALAALCAAGTRARVLWVLVAAGLLRVAPAAPIAPSPPRLVALDVGQGDALLVQGHSASLLVDAGAALPGGLDRGRRQVVPALRALGVERLDWLVASHADLDHRGGLPAVLRAMPVGELWLPFGGRADPDFAALVSLAHARGVPVVERGAGSPPVRRGDLGVRALWPPASGAPGARNDASLVLLVSAGERRVLLTGDLEAEGEAGLVAAGSDLGADVLKLPHHGSRTSTGAALLRAAAPAVAIASAPRLGRHPMPHREVKSRLAAAGVSLWWTGRDGAVRVSLAGPLTVWGTSR